MITPDHPAIRNIIAKRQKQVADSQPEVAPSLQDPPLFKKANRLLNPPLFNKLPALTKKFTAKSIGPVKSVPEPQSPTRPTKIPSKFDYNHTSKSWKPE